MPITKARLDRMIDMIDSAWLKRRDSENTDPKPFNEAAPQQPFSDSPPEMPKENLWDSNPFGTGDSPRLTQDRDMSCLRAGPSSDRGRSPYDWSGKKEGDGF